MIIFEHVTKVYNDVLYAVKDCSMHLEKGEICFITGSTGAGKTSLLNMIFSLVTPSQGEIHVQGRALSSLDAGDIQGIRRSIGYIFQDNQLMEDWSVRDNVEIVLEIKACKLGNRSRTWTVLKWVGLQHKMYEKACNLSGGEKKRLALARAIIHDPDIILADEPVGSLDEETGRYVMNLLYRFYQRGATVLIVSHNRDPLMEYARVIHMDRGRVVSDGRGSR
ncbi:MAG: ATP-binding cassette domain-containing protein [Thermodesulfobacteriota bacterium]|nr:ATP-binding cassette domain-containing protein [Thermodesulfobacteriota bacterium]